MAEPGPPTNANPAETPASPPSGRNKDDVVLELTKFIAAATGYGKPPLGGAGFSSKPAARTPEEQAESLLELFERCRRVVYQEK